MAISFNFDDPGRRFDAAYSRTNDMFRRAAELEAGRRMADGDYQAAAGALFRSGDLSGGGKVTDYGRAQADEAARRQAATALASGDWEGAAQGYGSIGERAGIETSWEGAASELKRQQDYWQSAASALTGLLQNEGPEGLMRGFGAIRKDLPKLGYSEEEIAQTEQLFSTDPKTALALISKAARDEYEFRSAGDETQVFNKRTGQLIGRYRGDKIVSAGPESDVGIIRGTGGLGAPQPNAWRTPGINPDAPPVKGSGPEGYGDVIERLAGRLEHKESRGKQSAVSPKGAFGVWQLMPGTAAEMAAEMGVSADQLRADENLNRQAGKLYLGKMLSRYGGNEALALAAYNAGPGRVDDWLKRNGDPRTGAISERDWVSKIPFDETRDYVSTIKGVDSYQVAGAAAPPQDGGGFEVLRKGTPKPTKNDPPNGYRWGGDGNLTFIPGGPADPEVVANRKPPTEGQTNAASLTFAALGGNERLNDLARQRIYKPTANLLVSEKNGVTRLVMSNEQDRLFVQAAKEFLAPILRKDTGAAVTDSEFIFYQDTYIPRPEDSPAVLGNKAKARDTALRRLYGAGAKAFDEEYGKPKQWQVLTDPRAFPKKGPEGQAKPQGGGRRRYNPQTGKLEPV